MPQRLTSFSGFIWMFLLVVLLSACGGPGDVDTLLQTATEAGANADWKKAEKIASRALNHYPQDYRVQMLMAFVAEGKEIGSGDMESAVAYARQAVTLQPRDYEANHLLGRLLMKRQTNPQDAILYLQRAADLDPAAFNNWALLAQAYERMRKYNEAMTIYLRLAADSVYGSNHAVYNELGRLYLHLTAHDHAPEMAQRAAEMFQRAASLAPEGAGAMNFLNLARTYDYYLKDSKRALLFYRRFIAAAESMPWLQQQSDAAKARSAAIRIAERRAAATVPATPSRRNSATSRRR